MQSREARVAVDLRATLLTVRSTFWKEFESLPGTVARRSTVTDCYCIPLALLAPALGTAPATFALLRGKGS
jgi:hypothetical protein